MDKVYLDHVMSQRHINEINSIDIPAVFAERIARLRVENGFSQRDMAYMLDISKATYERLEAAIPVSISVEVAIKLANIFRIPMMYLFNLYDDTIGEYAKYMQCTGRTQHLVSAIMAADLKAQEEFMPFDPNDIITVIQFSEEIHDGIGVGSFLHKTMNISEYRDYDWYKHADLVMQINSNSYHPLYHIGDRLILENRAPRNGEIGVYVRKSRLYIRRNVESQTETNLERVNIPIYQDADPMIVNRRSKEEMTSYTKLGVVIAVI